jgi:hypothetical protein
LRLRNLQDFRLACEREPRESIKYEPNQVAHLVGCVAAIVNRRAGKSEDTHDVFRCDSELEYDDNLLAQEIFWDFDRRASHYARMEFSKLGVAFFPGSFGGKREPEEIEVKEASR